MNDFPVVCYNKDRWQEERKRVAYAILGLSGDLARVSY